MSNYRGSRFNSEGYFSPTEHQAIGRIIREEKKTQKPCTQLVYICSPYRGETEVNVRNALRYCRFAVEQGNFPICPHIYLPQFMDDNIYAERELALSFGIRLLCGCSSIWVFGTTISGGMSREFNKARSKGIPVKCFTSDCKEVLR